MALSTTAPLAYRLRPLSLDDFVGQEDVVGKGTVLRTAIEKDTLSSVILAGPPGTGKTTIAKIIAETTKAQFVQINAVTSGIAELRQVCSDAERMYTNLKQRTLLFIDEIHRFNKSQQDALLPYVESGTVILVGATTENPYFSVNSALVSRSQVYLLKPHSVESLTKILRRAVDHKDGYDGKLNINDEALVHIATLADGDARIALNLLEVAVLTIGQKISLEDAKKRLASRSHRYDKKGEDHYDTISAFIKSMRASAVDASLVWLYKMIQSGEEPRFLFRRMAIFASEDIGMADPHALPFVTSAWQSFEMVGLPEGEFFLAHACIYLAQAPKSPGIKYAMGPAKKYVENAKSLEVPYHIRNAPVKAMKEHGYGKGYRSPHEEESGIGTQHYFPIGEQPEVFYEPTDRGYEAEVRERMEQAKKLASAAE